MPFKMFLAVAVTIAFAQVSPSFAASESEALIGKWALNVEQSIPPQGATYRGFTIVIRESGEFLDFTQSSKDSSGRITEFSHRTQTDGVTRELPGMPGARAAFTRLPSGVIDARLWFPDGSLQNKICVLQTSLRRQICLATITSPIGNISFFKHVLDKVE